jgi:nucleoside-diphosphate-sugar epimerase
MGGGAPTVLVTGATGQVGKLLTGLLLSRGRRVVAIDLPSDKSRGAMAALAGEGATGTLYPEFADITDPAAVRAVVDRYAPQAIVHLAAIVSPPCYRNPAGARRVNVDGTRHLVEAAHGLSEPPVFVFASSASVYGSRNPYSINERITPQTPPNPIDCYGVDKVDAEEVVRGSGLPHAILRLGGVVSPNPPTGPDYFLLMRALPRDTRVHMVDARDVALAFANAADRIDAVDGKLLLIGGDESYLHTHASVQDDVFDAVGLGRVGSNINLPGDPDDDRGWSMTDWYDTTESQQLLGYQAHTWDDTLAWVRDGHGRRRAVLRVVAPIARPALRAALRLQRRRDGRGKYADPWALITRIYGDGVVLPADRSTAG